MIIIIAAVVIIITNILNKQLGTRIGQFTDEERDIVPRKIKRRKAV